MFKLWNLRTSQEVHCPEYPICIELIIMFKFYTQKPNVPHNNCIFNVAILQTNLEKL